MSAFHRLPTLDRGDLRRVGETTPASPFCTSHLPKALIDIAFPGRELTVNRQASAKSDEPGPRRPVFISYATADRKAALSVCKAIERRGSKCWISHRDVQPGENYQEAIVEAIRNAPAMVLVFSEAANNSDEIKKELSLVSRYRIPVMALRIEDVEPSDAFAYELSTRQWIDAFEGWDKSIDALVGRLNQISGRAGIADASHQASLMRWVKPRRAWKRTAIIATSLILLFAIATLAWLLIRPSGTMAHTTEVRLAGFELLSPELPAGMPDALRDELIAAFGDDGVINASTAATPLAGRGPSFALRGTIRREGGVLKIIVRLTNERSGTTVWSDIFPNEFQLADRVPRRVAIKTALVVRCGLFGASTYPRTLPDTTLADYFQFCQNAGYNKWDTAKALDFARKVVAKVPDFSWGWSAVGNAIVAMYFDPAAPTVTDALRQEALRAHDRALALDPSNSEALADKSYLIDPGDLVRRERFLEQALKARQLACGCEHLYYGYMLQEVGRLHDAAEEFSRSTDILPLFSYSHLELGNILTALGQRQAAKPHIDSAIELENDSEFAARVALTDAVLGRDFAKAQKLISDPNFPAPPERKAAFKAAFDAILSGEPSAKSRAISELTARPAPEWGRVAASVLGELGANTEALATVETAAKARVIGARDWLYWPSMAGARSDRAFPGVAERLGLIRYWRTTKKRPDFCLAKNPPLVCRTI